MQKKTLFLKSKLHIYIYYNFCDFVFFFNTVFLRIQPLLWSFNLCFLVFVISFVPLRIQSSVPIFTWEQDYWLDCSLPLWTLLFLHQVASVSSLPLLFSTQLCESLCVPDGGEHLGNWLLAGSVSLLFISPFYPPGLLCLLPPSSLLTLWTSLSGPNCGVHIRKWLLASLLSHLWFHLISFGSPLAPSSLFSFPCNSVNLSGCPNTVEKLFFFNLDALSMVLYRRRSLETTVKIKLKN